MKFSADGRSVYYTVRDENHWINKVFLHQIGTLTAADTLVYEETDPRYYLDLAVTKDKKYLTITSSTKVNSEVHILDRQKADSKLRCIFPRELGAKAFTSHSESHFYILTNKDKVYDYKIVRLGDEQLSKGNSSQLVYEDFYLPKSG